MKESNVPQVVGLLLLAFFFQSFECNTDGQKIQMRINVSEVIVLSKIIPDKDDYSPESINRDHAFCRTAHEDSPGVGCRCHSLDRPRGCRGLCLADHKINALHCLYAECKEFYEEGCQLVQPTTSGNVTLPTQVNITRTDESDSQIIPDGIDVPLPPIIIGCVVIVVCAVAITLWKCAYFRPLLGQLWTEITAAAHRALMNDIDNQLQPVSPPENPFQRFSRSTSLQENTLSQYTASSLETLSAGSSEALMSPTFGTVYYRKDDQPSKKLPTPDQGVSRKRCKSRSKHTIKRNLSHDNPASERYHQNYKPNIDTGSNIFLIGATDPNRPIIDLMKPMENDRGNIYVNDGRRNGDKRQSSTGNGVDGSGNGNGSLGFSTIMDNYIASTPNATSLDNLPAVARTSFLPVHNQSQISQSVRTSLPGYSLYDSSKVECEEASIPSSVQPEDRLPGTIAAHRGSQSAVQHQEHHLGSEALRATDMQSKIEKNVGAPVEVVDQPSEHSLNPNL